MTATRGQIEMALIEVTSLFPFARVAFSTYRSYWLLQLETIQVVALVPSPLITFSGFTDFVYRKWQTRRKAGTQSNGSARVLADRQAAEGMNGI